MQHVASALVTFFALAFLGLAAAASLARLLGGWIDVAVVHRNLAKRRRAGYRRVPLKQLQWQWQLPGRTEGGTCKSVLPGYQSCSLATKQVPAFRYRVYRPQSSAEMNYNHMRVNKNAGRLDNSFL